MYWIRRCPLVGNLDCQVKLYLDLNGVNYEFNVIAPDYEIGYPRGPKKFLTKVMADLKEKKDLSIEKVLQLIENTNN
jgi:hypothetical protein